MEVRWRSPHSGHNTGIVCRGEAGDTGIKDWEAYLVSPASPQKTSTPVIIISPESFVTPKTINKIAIIYQLDCNQNTQQK